MNSDPNLAAEESNRRLWDEMTPVHYKAYRVKEFLSGECPLRPIELQEVGDVRGKDLLHLQCHFGMDTLGWARLGANVTGVDFSDKAIETACKLAEDAGLEARFVLSNVLELEQNLDGEFDVVYTGVGVLCWLRDLRAWARIIHRFLKPGGFFYIYETHPLLHVFDDTEQRDLVVRNPYFHRVEPVRYEGGGPDYADPDHRLQNPSHEWQWSLGDVVDALIHAGLTIEFLHEHATMPFPYMPGMVQDDAGMWHHPDHEGRLPLSFSLKARREESADS